MNLPPNNKVNPSWTSARALPARRSIYEPITYVPETGFFRENVPSPWDEKLSEHFNYGEIPTPDVRYAVIERQPGQNAWSNKFTGVDDQMVMQSPDLNAYDFEQPNYNRYKPATRQAVIVDDAEDWMPWDNQTPVIATQPVESSVAIASSGYANAPNNSSRASVVLTQAIPPPPRRAAIIDDDIDLGELEYYKNSVPDNIEFVAGNVNQTTTPPIPTPNRRAIIDDDIDLGDLDYFNNSVPTNTDFVASNAPYELTSVTPSVTPTTVDPYDFEGTAYVYRPEDDIQNFRSGTVSVPQQEPQHHQLEIDFNNPLHNDNSSLPHAGKKYAASLSPWERLKLGFSNGNEFGVGTNTASGEYDPTGKVFYSKSAIFDRAPKNLYDHLDPIGQAGFVGGRVASDIYGNGTRKYLWNIQPEDFTNTEGKRLMNEAGASRVAQLAIPYAATVALGVGSGNYDPTNVSEGGRPQGFSAINPGDDPRQSTSPLYDIAIERGMLGRRGRLLPWEQFHQERPDVSFDQYDKYSNYLRNKDDNVLRKMTGGLAKGTLDGVNGPEVSVMGYSVNPIGAAAAAGIIMLGRQGKLIR